tara:strand:- start:148 stop:789 length:642 start_codon:yes stop_codon:yes gene_type:complete
MENIGTIDLLAFARASHFESDEFTGTKIKIHPDQFMATLREVVKDSGTVKIADGYAPFCKHLFVPNFAGAELGDVEITESNSRHLHSGYTTRANGAPGTEIPHLTRWFDRSDVLNSCWFDDRFSDPETGSLVAKHLDVIIYSREHLNAENIRTEADWGIAAILAVDTPEEPMMTPHTMVRNHLGTEYGGSGHPIDREEFAKSVAYWNTHALVK